MQREEKIKEALNSLEELIKKYKNGVDLVKIYYYFTKTYGFSEKVVDKLIKLLENNELISTKNDLILWLEGKKDETKK